MLKITLSAVATLLGLSLIPDSAQAQSRVFVAAQGSDSNPCTFAAPCRTFQHAHDVVASNGEIDVLDPAGYGAVMISKAISIQGHNFSGISAPSGNAITINAGANDSINLRGLLIDGVGTGSNGVVLLSGASLDIQETMIRNFTNNAIISQANSSNTLSVTNTLVAGNDTGIALSSLIAGVNVLGVIDHVVSINNKTNGILTLAGIVAGTMRVTVTDSVIENSSGGTNAIGPGAGINCVTNNPTVVICTVRNSAVVNNAGTGLNAGGAAILLLTRSTITGNGVSWAGSVNSYGDNEIDFNLDASSAPPVILHK
jgi:hypothetical protein